MSMKYSRCFRLQNFRKVKSSLLVFLAGIILLLRRENYENKSPDVGNDITLDEIPPLCLVTPFFGQTSNNIIQFGKLLKIAKLEGKNRKIALDAEYSRWYQSYFDPREEVLLDFPTTENNCEKIYDGRKAYFQKGWNMTHLIDVVPSQQIRETATQMVESWPHGKNFISVHRRHLDGLCHLYAKCIKVRHLNCSRLRDKKEECSASIRHQACDMEYEMVSNPEKLPVVLFSDDENPIKDATFPHLFRHDNLFVEMWIMSLSKVHWGNPKSTLDIVVASWRRGLNMEPKECYGPLNIVYRP